MKENCISGSAGTTGAPLRDLRIRIHFSIGNPGSAPELYSFCGFKEDLPNKLPLNGIPVVIHHFNVWLTDISVMSDNFHHHLMKFDI